MNVGKAAKTLIQIVKHRKSVYQFVGFLGKSGDAFSASVQPHELDFLQDLVSSANELDGPIVEIGTLFGFTTQSLALKKNPDKELITVDNFRWNPLGLSSAAHSGFTHRILHHVIETSSTRIYKGSNVEFYNSYKGSKPSMVFIDAGHSYEDVMVDIQWAKEQGIPIISGHDYTPSIPGVVKAVDEAFGDEITVVGTVWSHRLNVSA